MYILYYSPGAASLCVHLALLEIGAPHELRKLDLAAGEQRSPAYLKLNPNGLVPTLLIQNRPFFEAAACLMTLAERHPAAALAPAPESLERAAWNQWILHLANTLQPAFRLWFYPSDLSDDGALQETIKAGARARIETVWQRLDAQLAAHGPYLLGDSMSAADLMLIMLMRWSRNMPRPATAWPHVGALTARLKARPSWKQVCDAEGLVEWA